MRRACTRAVLYVGGAIAFVVALLIVSEAALRWRGDLIIRKPNCGRQDPKELLRLAPNCDAWEDSPAGPYRFSTNEDGFRDRPRSFFANGSVFLLGDSHVEGFRLPVEKGLARRLEEELGSTVLNLGMQGSGPSQEALRAERALEHYRARSVVWILNPTDPLDEIFYSALANGEPNPLANPELRKNLLARIDMKLHGRSRLVQKLNEIFFLQAPYVAFMKGRRFDPAIHCRSIRDTAKLFEKRRIPLVFVLMSQGARESRQVYRGVGIMPEDYEEMIGCARATKRPIVDLREAFPDSGDYWPGDWHFTPEGTIKFARALALRLKPLLP